MSLAKREIGAELKDLSIKLDLLRGINPKPNKSEGYNGYNDVKVEGYAQDPFTFAKATDKYGNTGIGFAKCAKSDKFDSELGKNIATARALSQYYKELAVFLGKGR